MQHKAAVHGTAWVSAEAAAALPITRGNKGIITIDKPFTQSYVRQGTA